jgi:triosephosphate isomerase
MKKLIAGNWKMNTTKAEAVALAKALAEKVGQGSDKFDMVVCPPAIWLSAVVDAVKGSAVKVGAQDAHTADKGAFTGNHAAPMIKEAGALYVILGHSERRQYHKEDNKLVQEKAVNALKNGLIPIICVGEVEAERNAGQQDDVVGKQLAESLPDSGGYVVAYEPVWAIGTGKTATTDDIRAMHAFIRAELAKRVDHADQVAILYGGSANAANAKDILAVPNVDGVLVGGASLKADDFWTIAQAA